MSVEGLSFMQPQLPGRNHDHIVSLELFQLRVPVRHNVRVFSSK